MPPNNVERIDRNDSWRAVLALGEQVELLTDERKGCKKRRKGTKDQLIKDKMVIRNWKRILKNLVMG